MNRFRALFTIMFLLGFAAALPAVELIVTEPAGIARIDEPVTCGVPLPRGYARGADELILRTAIGQLPVEVREVSRWPDGSLSWVHLDFQLSLDAGGDKHLYLEKGTRQPLESRLRVENTGDYLTVTTGKLEARVRKSSFNVIEQLRVAGDDSVYQSVLISTHGGGIVAWQDTTSYRSFYDTHSRLEVESVGPMRLVLRSEGALADRKGNALLNYVCRLYFYNDSPVVRLALSVENRDSVIENKVALKGLHVEIPTMLRGSGMAYDLGMLDKDFQGVFDQRGALVFSQINDSEQAYAGTETYWEQDKSPKEIKSDRIGWASIGAGAGQVGVALRYYWQMHPSSLVLFAQDGFIQVGMFPRRLDRTLEWYAGVARTFYLRFAFLRHGDSEVMRSLVTADQKPLIARAAPEWYCDSTQIFGLLPTRDNEDYQPENRNIASSIDEELDAGLDNMLACIDNRTIKGVTRDGHGFLNWGDGLHYVWQDSIDEPGNLAWNHHYYDLPHVACLEFVRGGRMDWYEYFFTRTHHLMDVHMTHFGPGHPLTGRNRYNPPTDHVRIDPTDSGDYTTAEVYVSPSPNHHKTQSLFERWWLTGDERARDVALEGTEFVASLGGYTDFKQPRGAAHQVLTLVTAFNATGNTAYLDTARATFDLWYSHFQSTDQKFTQGYFMAGFLLEAFIDLYQVAPDPRIVDFVRQAVDWMAAQRPDDKFPNLALAAGFLAAQTGERKYTKLQKDLLSRWKGVQTNAFKDFASHGRSVARSLYYLTEQGLEK